jgi:molecular chaperone Hsp33
MEHQDTSQRFMIDDSSIRGEWCRIESTYQAVIAKHDYPLAVRGLLGEMMAAATMLSSTLKFEGRLTLQARGDGPLKLATVECTHDKHLRAIARWQGETDDLTFNQLLDSAHLAITIEPTKGKAYQGIVPLEHENLSRCLEHYFQQSEQLDTRIWLNEGDGRAAGFMIQVLPYNSTDSAMSDKSEDDKAEDWIRAVALADTLKAEEHLSLPIEELLHRLYHEESVRLFDAQPVDFKCSCSRERMSKALVSVGKDELDDVLAEQEQITMNCEFCNVSHIFDKMDVHMLFDASNPNNDTNTH